jgi:nuclease HARBI1
MMFKSHCRDHMSNAKWGIERMRRLQILDLVVQYVKVAGGWNKAFPPEGGVYETSFDLSKKDDHWILKHLRIFPRENIARTARVMGIPTWVVSPNRDRCLRDLAFIMLLYKMSFPRRLIDFAEEFGGNGARAMRICNALTIFLYERFRGKMETLDRLRMSDDYIFWLCRMSQAKHHTVPHVWGFIDATVRPCCRPVYFQEAIYNGKDRVHAIKFQTIVSVDGIICHCNGPWSGRRHDSYVYKRTLPHVLHELPVMQCDETAVPVAVYADPGYFLSTRVLMPYPDGRECSLHQAFNVTMSRMRITVEWGYSRVSRLWQHINFTDNQKVFKSPIGAQYMVAVLLTNAITCIDRGNEISDYFGCAPPTLEEFFATLSG